jgi:hypothetical protein
MQYACFANESGISLSKDLQDDLESVYRADLSAIRILTGPSTDNLLKIHHAYGFASGNQIGLCRNLSANPSLERWVVSHEIAHILQQRLPASSNRSGFEPGVSPAESEADQCAWADTLGLTPPPVTQPCAPMAFTPASTEIDRLITPQISRFLAITLGDLDQVLAIFKSDPDPDATIADLAARDRLTALVVAFAGRDFHRDSMLVQIVGSRISEATAAVFRPYALRFGEYHAFEFEVSSDLQRNLRALGLRVTSPTAVFSAPDDGSLSNQPFTGSGATGYDPTALSIPLTDQALLAVKSEGTVRYYTNPLGNLVAYLASLSTRNRQDQATTLTGQWIVSVVPASYNPRLPSRADIMRLAAAKYNLHPALIAGFILAEQRDQSRAEDAKDYQAAISVFQANTSLGLGQVVISTAKRNDLFSDLLDSGLRSRLSHDQIARLLESDEFNVFAAAKYLRLTANNGARQNPAVLRRTVTAFPGINFPIYGANSSMWPPDNIRALGSEYTSAPWDDVVTVGWGNFVYEAYQDVVASGAFR